MFCPEELTLSLYADGELGPEETAEIELHLKDCEACRVEVEALKQMDRMGRSALAAIPTNAGRTANESRSGRNGWQVAAWAAAALVALAFIVLTLTLPENQNLGGGSGADDPSKAQTRDMAPDAFSEETFQAWADQYKDLKIPLVSMDEVQKHTAITPKETEKPSSTL